MLPNYFVIGAAKCGTTTLCDLLGRHPDVFMSDPKEIHYFGREGAADRRAWYEAHFDNAGSCTAVGEGSTSYTHPNIIEKCAAEIAEAVPDARLLYAVRNPLRRLESDWKMRKHEGWAPEGSIDIAAEEPDTSLIRHGFYWQNLSVFRRYFDDSQIHIVFLEDFSVSPGEELRRCFAHIGVDPGFDIEGDGVSKNRSQDFRRDLPAARWLRKVGIVPLLRSLVPAPLFSMAKSVVTKPEPTVVSWTPKVRDRVVAGFADDARKFLEHAGKPAGFWTYPEPGSP